MSSFVNRSSRDRDHKAKKEAAKAAFAEAKKQREMQTMRVSPWKDMGRRNKERKAARSQGWRAVPVEYEVLVIWATDNMAVREAFAQRHGLRVWGPIDRPMSSFRIFSTPADGRRVNAAVKADPAVKRADMAVPPSINQPPGKERPSSYWTDVIKESGRIIVQPVPLTDAPTPPGWHLQTPRERCEDNRGRWRQGICLPYMPGGKDPEDTHVQDREESSERPGLEVDQEETEKRDAVRVDDSTTPGPETMPMEEKKGVNPLLLIGAAAGALLLATR